MASELVSDTNFYREDLLTAVGAALNEAGLAGGD